MKFQKIRLLAVIFAMGLLIAGCGAKSSDAKSSGVKSSDVKSSDVSGATGKSESNPAEVEPEKETAGQIDVVEEGMKAVYGNEIKNGVYAVKVDSSSNMFRITDCELTVKDGVMSAVMTMGGTGYLKLYMGTGEEAAKSENENFIPYVETENKTHTFEVPVEALDMGIDCSAFSKNKEKWYDRVLVFRADSLPPEAFTEATLTTADSLKLEDGIYRAEVVLEGGSGKASVETPATLRVEAGKVFATIIWSSANYDYMKVDGVKLEWDGNGENSTFEIPVGVFDWKIPVIADTIAMSEPHEIDYTLTFDSTTLKKSK